MAKKELEEKKVKKTETKKVEKKAKKKAPKVKKESYIEGVRQELKKVKWPSKQEVAKYTIATIFFVVFLVLLFVLINLGMSAIKGGLN